MRTLRYCWLLSLLLFACALLFIAGCAKKTDTSHTIRVVRNIGGREGFRLHWEAWKKAFEAKNPGWTMELIDMGNASANDFYKARIATNELPEVAMQADMVGLANNHRLIEIPDSFYEKFGIPLPAPYKGKRYTSQSGIQLHGIVINKKMWSDIGVTTPPASWDEFVADLAKLKAKGYKPLAFGGREWSAGEPLVDTMAINMFPYTPDPSKPTWTQLRNQGKVTFVKDPISRKVMHNMIGLLNNFVGKGATSNGYNEEQRDFYSGKAATWIMGCWVAGDLESNKVSFDTAYWPIPSMVGRPPAFWATPNMPSGWAITDSAKGEKLVKSMAVLETFYDPHVYQLFINAEGMFPTASKVAVKGPQTSWAPAQQLYDNMATNMKTYASTPGDRLGPDEQFPLIMADSTMRVMQEILAGNTNETELLQMLDDDWNSAMKSKKALSQQ